MATNKNAAEVVKTYFNRMLGRDPSVAELFHEDARLIGLGRVVSGKGAIREFYKGAIEGASPTPALVGELLASGTRVAAEINIALATGETMHVVDLFVVEDGMIRSLTYFVENH